MKTSGKMKIALRENCAKWKSHLVKIALNENHARSNSTKCQIMYKWILKKFKSIWTKGNFLNFKANINPMAVLSLFKPGWAEFKLSLA